MISVPLMLTAYLGAVVLFILSLGGFSRQETARRGNLYGIAGMALAMTVTILGSHLGSSGSPVGIACLVIALAVGGPIGIIAARKVEMTQMPELVALMHSLVGLAAVLISLISFYSSSNHTDPTEATFIWLRFTWVHSSAPSLCRAR